ncbi:MAG: hypothetical protein CVU56_11210 [Deltaproteobacteria bacterium HGW-Deltaproteobacteria-14]|jgi:nitrate reductase delta subunit|nr:MAG: hypothetical protein CVU56_11210 [Deltaproteobacteria bacterium HGW-Deltaproteobacteria-14]
MVTPMSHRWLLAHLGEALDYPDERLRPRLDALAPLARDHGPSAAAVDGFLAALAGYEIDALSEIYTRTFDVAPICVPYLSIHLFGEESFRRASLMTGLSESLAAAGVDLHGELPDHLAVVLRAAPALPDEVFDELLEFVLRAGVHAMVAVLDETPNPYRWLLRAVQAVVGPASADDLERLAAARRESQTHRQSAATGAGAACGGR